MKKYIQKIPRNAATITLHAITSVVLLTSTVSLPLMVAELAPEGVKLDYVLYACVFSLLGVAASFVAGYDWSRRSMRGRMMRFDELICPGTLLPQGKSFFHFLGKHELGNGWVVATFQKVAGSQCLKRVPGTEVCQKNLFSVLTRGEALPQNPPCVIKFEYDQRFSIRATIIQKQAPERN